MEKILPVMKEKGFGDDEWPRFMLETGAGLLSWDGTYMMNVMEPLEFVIVSVLAFNLLGDGLRAVLPSLRRRKAKAGSPVSSRVTKPSTSVGQSPRSTRCLATLSTLSASSPRTAAG